ncbi:MAG: hypothetical protein GEU74_13145 [Nitriliruptorales bacterium]|nr:hypothetical protein [Nitriliruptorales bacterium]
MFATGCSDSAQEQEAARQRELTEAFAPTFNEASSHHRTTMAEIQGSGRTALEAGDEDAVLDVYRSLRDASGAAADEFETLEAPANVSAQHQSLIENLRRQQQSLDDIVTAAEAQQDAALTEELQGLASLLADFATIHTAIDTKLAQGP